MKCLIVGGGGFMGSWLTRELQSRRHKVVIIDPFIYYSSWDDKAKKTIDRFKKEELLKGAKIYKEKFESSGEKIIKKEKPDAVIHLAGIPLEKPTDFEFSSKQLRQDIGLTYEVVRAVKDNLIKRFIFMSSISAYGECPERVDENAPLLPRTPYGITKAAGEYLVQSELDIWNIIRTTNVFGFGDMNGRGSNIILNKILKGEKFWVNSNVLIDFTYVKDLVRGIAAVLTKAPKNETFHINGGNARSLLDYVKILAKHFDFDYEVREIKDRPSRGTMNTAKAKKILGWYPKTNLKTAVEDYLKYIKKYGIA